MVEKIKKIALILLIWLLTIYSISVIQIWPITLSLTSASFTEIPIFYWLMLLVSPVLLYLIAKDSKNPLVPVSCIIIYFFLFYSIGLYFMCHPTFSDISSSTRYQEIVGSVAHISPREIDSDVFVSAARYFRWPVYFIFSKIFSSVLGLGSLQTLNLGFFSLILILPFILTLYYKRSNEVENSTLYFIYPALYLTIAWHFLNDQFVPQFLGLIYLFIAIGCYLKYRNEKSPLFMALMIIFYALTVFTHAFIFIFLMVAIIFELYWSEYVEMKRPKYITYGLVIILFAMLFPYLDIFYGMATTTPGGGSWRLFEAFFAERNVGGAGVPVHILYNLVARIYDQIFSEITRMLMVIVFSLVAIGSFLYIFKKRPLFDLSILIGSASWFALGLAQLVLGQRAIQVAALPLARNFKYPHKLFSYILKVIIIVILIAPTVFIANDSINSSIEGDKLIHDPEENIAGRFMDKHITNQSIVYTAQNPYPTGYPSGFQEFFGGPKQFQMIDIMLDSPKLKKIFMYLNVPMPESLHESIIYDNKDIEVVLLK